MKAFSKSDRTPNTPKSDSYGALRYRTPTSPKERSHPHIPKTAIALPQIHKQRSHLQTSKQRFLRSAYAITLPTSPQQRTDKSALALS
ncbi:hypothetical protein, partial [Anabaena sp. PCC 7938]|uniref:hypothetical protein n=1 Tax=Anabaena sp. PCC 7938 TaxID=1296340 RepID=UPI002030F13B